VISLALDASTYEGTVAVFDGERMLADGVAAMRGRDAERLMPAVEFTLQRAGVSLERIERVACGAGPGSFTSLRIAGSLAKGMALGRGVPLFAVSSLALVVAGNAKEPGRYLALLDAIRGDYFAAVFTFDGTTVSSEGEPTLIAKSGVGALASKAKARPVGPEFDGAWSPHARGAVRVPTSFAAPVNLATWEPTYGRLAEAQVKLEAAGR
jgi:tRNA threonylcarbamoyladenosine biosynthesis protein TsaB